MHACALIFPSLQDEAVLVDSLRNTYDLVDVRRRGASRKDPAVFRFDATRVIAKLRAGSSGVVADRSMQKYEAAVARDFAELGIAERNPRAATDLVAEVL